MNRRGPLVAEEANKVPTRNPVLEAADELASTAWQHRDEPGSLARVSEIRSLAIDQVADDTYHIVGDQRDRVGRQWVNSWSWIEEEPPERSLTPDQLALQASIGGLLDKWLQGEDRLIIRWLYDGRLSQRDIAQLLRVSQPTIHRRVKALHELLKTKLLEEFPEPNPEEVKL